MKNNTGIFAHETHEKTRKPDSEFRVFSVFSGQLLLLSLAVLLSGCAQKETRSTTPPAITNTGEDLRDAAAKATQAYIDVKNGDASFAWSVKKGLEAYQIYLKTREDVKALVTQWSDGTKAGKTFAEKLAALFASSTGTPEEKAAALAAAVQRAAQHN